MSGQSKIVVSVIVPAYNYANYLPECLDSVKAQSFQNWECIIIDNGSTDNTKEVVQKYVTNDSRFKYLYTENKGVSKARNLGVKNSSGEFILPLDADDKIHPSLLQKEVEQHQKNKDLTLVYSEAELFGNSSGKWNLPEYSFKDMLVENSIFCTAMYKRADFDRVGGYNENMHEGFEDWDFWIALLQNDAKVYRVPEVLFYYRIRTNTRNSVLDKEKQLRLRNTIYTNHKAVYDQYFAAPDLIFDKYLLSTKLNSLEGSKDYKVGKKLLSPLRFIKSLFGK